MFDNVTGQEIVERDIAITLEIESFECLRVLLAQEMTYIMDSFVELENEFLEAYSNFLNSFVFEVNSAENR